MMETFITRTTAAVAAFVLTAAGVVLVASPAGAAPLGGSGSGTGSSTFMVIVNTPAVSNVSTGTFRSTGLGNGTYALNVGTAGIATFVDLSLTVPSGSIEFVAGPLIGPAPQDLVLTASSGTGRFRHTSGTVTITTYTQTNRVCDPRYPVPIVCSWSESLTFDGSLRHT